MDIFMSILPYAGFLIGALILLIVLIIGSFILLDADTWEKILPIWFHDNGWPLWPFPLGGFLALLALITFLAKKSLQWMDLILPLNYILPSLISLVLLALTWAFLAGPERSAEGGLKSGDWKPLFLVTLMSWLLCYGCMALLGF